VADLDLTLGLDAKQIYHELQQVTQKLGQFANQAKQEGEKASKGFSSGFGSSIGRNITEGLAAIGIGSKIHEVVEYGAKVQDLSDRFGVTTDTIQKFGNAAELHGSSLEAVARGFRFLEVNQEKALHGNKAMLKAFEELGISAQQLKELRVEDIMLKLGNSSLNAADVVKVLGKSSLELRPVLAGLADGTIQFGSAIDKVDIAKLKEADDAFKKLHQTVTIGLGTVIGNFFTNLEASIHELVGKVFAGVELLGGLKDAVGNLLHGDRAGAAKAIETAKGRAASQVAEANKDAEEIRHPELAKKRDFGVATDDESQAGATDDQGRPLSKSEASSLDKARKKDKKEERQAELAALEPEARLASLKDEQGQVAAAIDAAKSEKEKLDLRDRQRDIVKEIAKTEKEQAEETHKFLKEAEKLEKERLATLGIHGQHTRSGGGGGAGGGGGGGGGGAQPPATGPTPEEIQAAKDRDTADRRAHGSYISQSDRPGGGLHTGSLVTGHVQGASQAGTHSALEEALKPKLQASHLNLNDHLSSAADFHAQFAGRGDTKSLADAVAGKKIEQGDLAKLNSSPARFQHDQSPSGKPHTDHIVEKSLKDLLPKSTGKDNPLLHAATKWEKIADKMEAALKNH
jgi:hypothetical protein